MCLFINLIQQTCMAITTLTVDFPANDATVEVAPARTYVTRTRTNVWLTLLQFNLKVNGKIFYGQEPPSGESTTTEYGFNYQLLAVIY